MPQPARPQVMVDDFPGILENVDSRDQPAGAAEAQVNACSIKVGELLVRLGLREVVFDA